MAKATGHAAKAQAIAKKLAKASPKQAPALIYDAFQLAALGGVNEAAEALLRALYATPPAKVFTALSTHAIDGFAAAAGLGDVTGGQPASDHGLTKGGTLDERVAASARGVRARLTYNSFAGDPPTDDAWRAKDRGDPWFAIDRWRRIQCLLAADAPGKKAELDALARLRELLADPASTPRGPGGTDPLVLALDLALRHGATADVDRWLDSHRAWFDGAFVIETMLCVPAIARAMVAGTFRPITGDPAALATPFADVLRAAGVGARAAAAESARPAKPPKGQKRRVEGEYSQVHLEPEQRSPGEAKQVYFQDKRESPQGMSLFPTMVAIGTPTDTGRIDVVITVATQAPPLDGAVQAVAFPIDVRGPLVIRSVSDSDDAVDAFVVPAGRYDVQAAFTRPKNRPRPRTGLQRLDLALTFCPAGSLGAPRCHRLEDGAKPPAKIFVNRP